MKNEFDIHPYERVGKLSLGMSPEDVNLILGSPDSTSTSDPTEIRESREGGGLQTVYNPKDRRLVEIGFGKSMVGLTFKGLPVFLERPIKIFQKFIQEDTEPYESYGFIILLNIGVTLTGFHDNSPDDRAVTIFEKGRWDSERSDMKSYKFR